MTSIGRRLANLEKRAEPPIDWTTIRIAETLCERRSKRLGNVDPLLDPERMPLIGAGGRLTVAELMRLNRAQRLPTVPG